ncbi:cell division ATPase FtsA [Filimonas zeae]|uniref:LysM domain-containing protein n=1 Tax=Filimonas zeae TaxID=1737353 RepID=A0A917MY41_9BACT|nr:hypothetical protein [Filimonas zeae]MDR6340873.1 cell division ATPase FtsA [Filimonas zeae]GGH78117.1 hypothetical protein GCM10011379_45510 [Filimonas zeae]
MKVEVLEGQTLADISIQTNGDLGRIIEIAMLNGISITDDIAEGVVIEVPAADNDKQSVVAVFNDKADRPASKIQFSDIIMPEGIAYWTIGLDFKVS